MLKNKLYEQIRPCSILIGVLGLLSVACAGRKRKLLVVLLVSVAHWHKESKRKSMMMWHETFIGNSVAKGGVRGQIDGIIKNLMQILKVGMII